MKNFRKNLKNVFICFVVTTIVFLTIGCADTSQLKGLSGGTISSSGLDNSTYKDQETKDIENRIMYDSLNILILALKSNKVDVALLDNTVASFVTKDNQDLDQIANIENTTANYAMCFKNENINLRDDFNNAISELKSEGKIDEIIDKYITKVIKGESIGHVDTIKFVDANKTIKVGITGDLPPMDFIDSDGNPTGFNIALLNCIAEKLHVNFDIVIVESNARASSLMSNKIDCIFWTQTICKNNDILSSKDIPDNTVITDYYYQAPLSKVFYKSNKNLILK